MVAELRPSARFSLPSYARWLVPLALLVALLSPGGEFGYVLAGLGLGAVLMGANLYVMASARLVARGGEVYYRQRGSERLVAGAGQLRVVQVQVRGAAHPAWQIWAGADGAVALVEQAWGATELLGLAQQLDAEIVTVPDPVSMREVAERYPGTLPWCAKHTVVAGIALAVGVMAAVALLDSV